MQTRCPRLLRLPVAVLLLLVAASPIRAEGRVQLELVGEARGASLTFQDWARTLANAGIRNVRIRAATGAERVGIEIRGTGTSRLYVVTGIIRSRDELLLPPGRFRRGDAGRLARWLDDLARLGPEDRREPKSAFGLSASQFEQILEDASQPVAFATAGVARGMVVDRIGGSLLLPLSIEPGLADSLKTDKLDEELLGLSSGTALAYVLRPMGMCMVPRQLGGSPAYTVVKSREGLEIWPVGWDSEKPARDVLPALYEFHSVNIQGVPASRALTAIGKILDAPVLIDHSALARHGIDPAKAMVTHPRSRTTYSLVLRKILFQAGLKFEVRLDEADRPFLWISTVKPV